jgi:hypothetical protein
VYHGDMPTTTLPAFDGLRFAAADYHNDHGQAQRAALAVAVADGWTLDSASWTARKDGFVTMQLSWNQARQASRCAYTWTAAR